VEGGVEGDGDERGGPHAEAGVDEEAAAQTGEAYAEEVGAQTCGSATCSVRYRARL
jgi:hypothetical protein